MECVKCKKRNVDNLRFNNINYDSSFFVYCRLCREDNRPNYIPDSQYYKYWLEFSKKWRNENVK